MPTYDYRCTKCGHRFELFHSIKDDAPKRCPKCRGKCLRVPAGGAGLLFRGSGFYITDYRSKSYREKAKQEKGSSGGQPAKSEKGSGGEKAKPEKASGGETSQPRKPSSDRTGGSAGKQGASGD